MLSANGEGLIEAEADLKGESYLFFLQSNL